MNVLLVMELVVLASSGLVLLLAGVMGLLGAERAEISLRSVSAFAIGAAGIGFVSLAITGETIELPSLLMAIGIALWVVRQILHKPQIPMRRATDWMPLDGD